MKPNLTEAPSPEPSPTAREAAGMAEPYLSDFRVLVRAGASVQDIHDIRGDAGYASADALASEAYVEREVARVRMHQRSLCPLLEKYVGRVENVLDVGCSTGGTTVAVALSPVLKPGRVVGVDPNGRAVEAARVRGLGYHLDTERLSFQHTRAGERLPFPDGNFDLTLCVSVLEFVSTLDGRFQLVSEMRRVTRQGGYVYLSTPSPFHLRELHSGVLLGDFIRRDGFPWASTPRQIRSMLTGCELVALDGYLVEQMLRRLKASRLPVPRGLIRTVMPLLRWQKVLARVT